MPNTHTHTIQSTHVYDCTISTCMLADWTFTRYHTLPNAPITLPRKFLLSILMKELCALPAH